MCQIHKPRLKLILEKKITIAFQEEKMKFLIFKILRILLLVVKHTIQKFKIHHNNFSLDQFVPKSKQTKFHLSNQVLKDPYNKKLQRSRNKKIILTSLNPKSLLTLKNKVTTINSKQKSSLISKSNPIRTLTKLIILLILKNKVI